MFALLLAVLLLGIMVGVYWVTGTIQKLYGVSVKRWTIRVLRIGIGLLSVILCMRWRTVGLIVIHLVVLFAVTNLIAFLARHFWKNERAAKLRRVLQGAYHSGLIPVLILCLMLG